MEQIILGVEQVSKSFGKQKVVSGVSLRVKAGEIYTLIGPNGSGKTTLLKMIVGLLSPDEGRVLIYGIEVKKKPVEAKKFLGYVADRPEGYGYLTGREFLYLTGKLKGVGEAEIKLKIKDLIVDLGIVEVVEQRMEGYSRGSWQKVAFLAALLGEPKLLVIDEPVAGLDPESIKVFGAVLEKEAEKGVGVIMVTHTLEFAQDYADRAGMLIGGKLKKEREVSAETNLRRWFKEVAHG